MAQGNHSKALPLFKQCFQQSKAVTGDSADTLTSLGNLAGSHFMAGDFAKAVQLYEECVTKRREILGEQHPSTLSAMKKLEASRKKLASQPRKGSILPAIGFGGGKKAVNFAAPGK